MPNPKPTPDYEAKPTTDPRWIPVVSVTIALLAGQCVGWTVYSVFGRFRFISFCASALAVAIATEVLMRRRWRRTHRN